MPKDKQPALCPKCGAKMDYQPQCGNMPDRFLCICGNSIFNFTIMKNVEWDALPDNRRPVPS